VTRARPRLETHGRPSLVTRIRTHARLRSVRGAPGRPVWPALPLVAVLLLAAGGCAPAPSAPTGWASTPPVDELDPYATSAGTVDRLHAAGARVLCRLALGVDEVGRPDFDRLPARVRGARVPGASAYWLDVRRLDVLLPVLADRLELCREKGFDAVAAGALDGYRHASGFPLGQADQLAFDRAVLGLAHEHGIGIALRVPPPDAAALAAGAVSVIADPALVALADRPVAAVVATAVDPSPAQ
jgi:Glycoside-hydrolase family GH114